MKANLISVFNNTLKGDGTWLRYDEPTVLEADGGFLILTPSGIERRSERSMWYDQDWDITKISTPSIVCKQLLNLR